MEKMLNNPNASRHHKTIPQQHNNNNNNNKDNISCRANYTHNTWRRQCQFPLPAPVLYFLLLILIFNGILWHVVGGMEYSARLSNCYDINYGFDEHFIGDASAKRFLNHSGDHDFSHTSSRGLQQQPDNAQQLPINTPRNGVKTMAQEIFGWKCCCWNATSQDLVECRCEGAALTRIPQTLTVPLQRLVIASAGLPRLRNGGLKIYATSLKDIMLTDLKELECIQDGAFAGLRQLRTIYISHAPMLTHLSKDVFQGISDTIKIIRIINSGLKTVPDFSHLPPQNILQMIDLDNNEIAQIESKSICIKTDQLILANNDIHYIDDSAFFGSQIAKLILKENPKLRQMHPNTFNGLSSMRELDLSRTSLTRLPRLGLQDIEELRIENTQTLKTIPSIYNFKNLQKAYLTHSFHCCAFKYPSRHDPQRHAERLIEIEKWRQKCIKHEDAMTNSINELPYARSGDSSSSAAAGIFYSGLESLQKIRSTNETALDTLDYMGEEANSLESSEIGVFHDEITIDPDANQLDEYCGNFTFRNTEVECYPLPDALNPCEDVMGYSLLRTSVWVVVALAVVGNIAVLVVILSIRSELNSVPRFLMCHLAFADLCLGLYLLLIAAIDAHSMGEYFNYAYDWQYGAGCKLAGFLTVFASHLSVFTLTLITIERWFAITHAMYLNRRIKLKTAAYVMSGGWIYSIVMSMMPLFGISNYSSTSICLPMEIRDSFDVAYLVSILGLNGVSFFIIAICYAQIYLSLGRETRQSTNPGELSIAKKMALLVFTNFACWAPIAFFGLTALAGFPLINVTKSKILLVFFYPLNSCADPYLYAILTSQYRQDLYTLLLKLGICKKTAIKYKNSVSIPGATHVSGHRQSTTSVKSHKSHETQLMLTHREDFV